MKLSDNPQEIDKHNWYYEHKTGIEVIHEIYMDGVYQQTDHIKIPWSKLRNSVRRFNSKRKRAGIR